MLGPNGRGRLPANHRAVLHPESGSGSRDTASVAESFTMPVVTTEQNQERRCRAPWWLVLPLHVPLLLSAGIMASSVGITQSTRARMAARAQIGVFKAALQLYQLDNGSYPTTRQGLDALVQKPHLTPRPKHWKKDLSDTDVVPKDPWGNEYHYEAPGPNGEDFYIVSYADGEKSTVTAGEHDIDSNVVP